MIYRETRQTNTAPTADAGFAEFIAKWHERCPATIAAFDAAGSEFVPFLESIPCASSEVLGFA